MVDFQQQRAFGFFQRLDLAVFGDVNLGREVIDEPAVVVPIGLR